jgi:hypothetical protein
VKSAIITRNHVGSKEWPEFRFWIVFWEERFKEILGGQVQCLSRKVTDTVGKVSSPKGTDTLFRGNTSKSITNSSISGNFTADNLWIGILGLDNQLDSFNRSGQGLGDSTRNTTGKEILGKLFGKGSLWLLGLDWSRG